MDSKTLTTRSQLFCNLGWVGGKSFCSSCLQVCFPLSSDEQEPLIYHSLSLCLQTHRKLDWIADSERCWYGALHWPAKTVSIMRLCQSHCAAYLESDGWACGPRLRACKADPAQERQFGSESPATHRDLTSNACLHVAPSTFNSQRSWQGVRLRRKPSERARAVFRS